MLEKILAEHLFLIKPEKTLIGTIDKGQGAVRGVAADKLGLVFDHGPVKTGALAQRLFHDLAPGDILGIENGDFAPRIGEVAQRELHRVQ